MTLERCQRCGVKSQLRIKDMREHVRLALMMAMTAMFTLAGYELMRSASTVLFKQAYGAENLPLVMAVMPLVMLLGVWGYGRLLSAVGPQRTLSITTILAAGIILLAWALYRAGMVWMTPILFLVKEFYVVLLIEQYWSYMNSKFTPDAAKRLNGPITGIAGLGSVAGGWAVAQLAVPLGTDLLIPLAALALFPSAWLANRTYARFGEPEPEQAGPEPGATDAAMGGADSLGWQSIRRSKQLTALLAVVLATQIIAAVLDFKFQGLLSEAFAGKPDEETAFQGQFWFYLNSAAVTFQFVLTPLLLSLFALRLVHLLMPLVHIAVILWAILDPSVFSVGAAFFLFKMFDYSLFRASKELIYLPLSFSARYRAKEFIDVFGYRTGKGGSSLVVLGLQKLGIAMMNYYLMIALAFALIWLALVIPLTDRES